MSGDFYFESAAGIRLHGYRWEPEGAPKAIIQIIHGIAEHVGRYDGLARYLTSQGYLVVAEDHMGHGKSICAEVPQGYFAGGWDAALENCCLLLRNMKAEYPGVPYILYGHSMGSFLTRSILIKHPDSGIDGAIICGTGWMPGAVIGAGKAVSTLACKAKGEQKPSKLLKTMMFGSYNKKIEHQRTPSDWLTRDSSSVDAFLADPLCGFVASAGLVRDMMSGLLYIQNSENLDAMKKDLPVFFIAGGDDPVGNYGAGVRQAVEEFKKHGMEQVSVRIYPLCRHEIHNELNKEEVYCDVTGWMEGILSAAASKV